MKRRIAIIVVLLFLGAIVNIAIAWGCALRSRVARSNFDTGAKLSMYRHPGDEWSPRNRAERRTFSMAMTCWPALGRRKAVAYQQFSIQCWHGFGTVIASGFADDGEGERIWSQTYRSGWPFRSLRVDVTRTGAVVGGLVVSERLVSSDRAGMFVHWEQPDVQSILPLRPILIGFVLNMLIYAGVFWLLFVSFCALRRMIRRKRGLCEKCAYPIGTWGGSPVCTECGAAVGPSVARSSRLLGRE